MYVQQITLQHFRNYEHCSLHFDSGIHLFIGHNAQGKTNLLEAIYVLALAKSHRTNKDKELISWHNDQAIIQSVVQKEVTTTPLELHITKQGKKAKYNHLEQYRLSDYIGQLNVVMFAPEDLEIVKGSPHIRRKFLDMEIGQVNGTYLHHLSQYHKVLAQRNALLKDWRHQKVNEPMLEVFTNQLIQEAVKVIQRRIRFVHSLQAWAAPIHEQISDKKEQLSIHYKYSTGLKEDMLEEEMIDCLQQQFTEMKEQEQRRGTTLIGPHRDDLQFTINDKHVQTFGSQGQQRTTALALKLAEIELIRAEIGEYPVLLLDDVLSELDDHRRSHLLQAMQNKVQTFVTNTSLEGIDERTIKQSAIYDVQEGQIYKRKR